MKIKILCIGKTKDAWCRAGEEFYLERISAFVQVEKIEIPEEKITATVAGKEIQKREGARLLSHVPKDFITIACTPSGKELSSEQFASFLQKIKDVRGGKICFLIGGPLGLANEILAQANERISFSALTFPHDLFRIILLEQLYRACTIAAGKKYHK